MGNNYDQTSSATPTTISRWWIYQRERFPLFAHGALIAVFSLSAISYSALARGQNAGPSLGAFLTAFVTTYLFFVQLRIADEFKDIDDDTRYRPYRAVPRGLVSLRELGWIGYAGLPVQIALAFWLRTKLLLPLAFALFYLHLRNKEFYVRNWLKAHPFTYMWSHLLILPAILFYATACDWLGAGAARPTCLGWFLSVSFFNGAAYEIARKSRAPQDEEPGVETYTFLWGSRNAVLAWWIAFLLMGVSAWRAAAVIHAATPVLCLMTLMVISAAFLGREFLREPVTAGAKRLETFTRWWTIIVYFGLGPGPLLLRV
jgi:4-hydroxybenzoate polyprenyltransferase